MKKVKPAQPPEKTSFYDGGRIVLLSVTGQSPAVLTETVWALAQHVPPIIPDRVVIITTSEGRQTLVRELLCPDDNCVWDQLRARLQKLGHDVSNRLQFGNTPDDIRVFTRFDAKSKRTKELADIVSEEENLAAADFIMEQVRMFAMDDDVHLVASVAGGRKTMSALLFAVMSLLGKQDDLLTHVLVNEPFESRGLKPRFYFPPEKPVQHQGIDRAGNSISVSSDAARIQLGKIPFVALRLLFERDLKKKQSYSALVETCQGRVLTVARENIRELIVRRRQPAITVNGIGVNLSPAEYTIMRYLAEAAKAGKPPIDGHVSAANAVQELAEKLFEERNENDFSDWRFKILPEEKKGGAKGFDLINQRWVTRTLSDLRTKFRESHGSVQPLAGLLPAGKLFVLNVAANAIRFED